MNTTELLSQAWSLLNRRRGVLIDKQIAGTMRGVERVELDALQAFADKYLAAVAPRPTDVLDELDAVVAREKSDESNNDER